MPRIIMPDTKMYSNCLANSEVKQGGLCFHCKRMIITGENIVSNGKNAKYYHESCAKKLLILLD